jgi:hypothetical protein
VDFVDSFVYKLNNYIFKIESGSWWDLKNNCEWANKSPLRVIKAPKKKFKKIAPTRKRKLVPRRNDIMVCQNILIKCHYFKVLLYAMTYIMTSLSKSGEVFSVYHPSIF